MAAFQTPAPKMISHYPGDWSPQHLDVPMFIQFDQKIDATAVIKKLQVKAPVPPKRTGTGPV